MLYMGKKVTMIPNNFRNILKDLAESGIKVIICDKGKYALIAKEKQLGIDLSKQEIYSFYRNQKTILN